MRSFAFSLLWRSTQWVRTLGRSQENLASRRPTSARRRLESNHAMSSTPMPRRAHGIVGSKDGAGAYLGIASLNGGNVGDWIRQHTDRHHLFIPGDEYPVVASSLETYARGCSVRCSKAAPEQGSREFRQLRAMRRLPRAQHLRGGSGAASFPSSCVGASGEE